VILAHELRKQNLEVARQVPIPIVYDGHLKNEIRRIANKL